ncbi:Microsomal signal peptidase 12 kDa subunit (SPC12) family protein [Theileria parva strain Muguga]|uniref:Microsomal signal peptidase 12 kDa subunit (SPC12) family protein n=1 Tax=Theileria parva strain Muguga TaxID=333668 RepID=UPI001C61CAD3|nr:Microsomal signal peptidase 12 kDa subunit (SPC12) family protein [Theileria parva strain Muguga]KAF5153380.1 Microsomal signal peptidase 12 kDa subunit (SPC12) family protein [Theileria parva strain Muguga]
MIAGLLEHLEDYLENSVVDFHGQFYSTLGMWIITAVFGLVGFAYGYITQSFLSTLKFIAAGTAVSILVCAVPWPFYSLNKINYKHKKN